jgi:2-amino-4-hydroxy-6-hydroxymethyldihydropteridine diphosphokinase
MQVLITLGSNIDREQNIDKALARLERHPHLHVLAASPVYVTPAIGQDGALSGQTAFSNAAIRAETDLDPARLREMLRLIEADLGRVRTQDKFAPRPIDLDLASYGQSIVEVAGKTLPDADILHFAHVAIPLAAVAGDWIYPQTGQTLAEIAAQHSIEGMEIIQ